MPSSPGPRTTGSDPFVHLHVASGYSLRHGASHPRVLVERAAEHGMDTLALTDRDGAYGVVKFAKACAAAGVRPVFGVDLAVAPVELDPSAAGRREARDPAGRVRPARSIPAHGGAFLVHGSVPEVLEGDAPGALVLIGFPDLEHARAWYGSPEYQAILPLRTRNSEGFAVLLDGVPDGYRASSFADGLARAGAGA